MKKTFSDPEVKVIRVESDDVICTSEHCETGGNEISYIQF